MRHVHPRSSKLLLRTCAAAGAVAIVLGALTGCTAGTASLNESKAILTGQEGAAHFDDGYLQIGTGPRTVDLYVDAMCPYCKLFEQTAGPQLYSDAAAGLTTIRLHPLAILDRFSNGSAYSTRAATYVTAVAATEPDKLQTFVQALYDHQPEEGSAGLTNHQLDDLAEAAGVSTDLTPAAYEQWVRDQTALATQGPLGATDQLTSIQQVPTVIVQGDVFRGNSTDADSFQAFYQAH